MDSCLSSTWVSSQPLRVEVSREWSRPASALAAADKTRILNPWPPSPSLGEHPLVVTSSMGWELILFSASADRQNKPHGNPEVTENRELSTLKPAMLAQHLRKRLRDQGLDQGHKQMMATLGQEPRSPGARLGSRAGKKRREGPSI